MKKALRPHLSLFALGSTAALLLAACGQEAPSVPKSAVISAPAVLSVTPAQATLRAAGSLTFQASSRNVTWQASGGSLSGSGAKVTWTAPTAPGRYTITATAKGGQAVKADVTVQAETPLERPIASPLGFMSRVKTDAAGNIYVAGEEHENKSCADAWPFGPVGDCQPNASIAKLDSTGALLWQKTFSPANGEAGHSTAYDLVLDSSGNSFILTDYKAPGSAQSVGSLIKISSSGEVAWIKPVTTGAIVRSTRFPFGPQYPNLDKDSKGNIYRWYFEDGKTHLVRYASDGSESEQTEFQGNLLARIGPDDNIYSADIDPTYQDVRVVRSTLNGSEVWQRHFDQSGTNTGITLDDLAFGQADSVYILWRGQQANVKKYSRSGQWQWNTELKDDDVNYLGGLLNVAPDNTIYAFMSGSATAAPPCERRCTDYGTVTFRLSSSGPLLERRIPGSVFIQDAAFDPFGGLLEIRTPVAGSGDQKPTNELIRVDE